MPYMASTTHNAPAQQECFQKFFECWLVEQNQFLEELISASSDQNNSNPTDSTTIRTESATEEEERVLRPLINRVVRHYEEYYKVKSRWVKQNVLAMLTPTWRSSLEDAFLWIGGWRPSMAFHLLYSKSGLQLEGQLADLLRGVITGDLADLAPRQLTRIDELQRRTIREEKEITEKLAKHQETVADSSMVELSHVVTEFLRKGETTSNGDERVESTLASKEEGLENIMERADDMRLRTLRAVIEILTPAQAVHFLIAAAELHLRLHDWGKKRDSTNNCGN